VAATNVRLEQAVAAGHFRSDLYYRLNVAVLELLPLSQRPGDILALADHFVNVYSKRLGLRNVRLSDAARQALLNYSWPGNIRELENVVHYALIVNSDGVIAVADLRLRGVYTPPATTASVAATVAAPTTTEADAPVTAVAAPSLPADPLAALAATLPALFASPGNALYERIESLVIQSAYAHCQRNQVHTAALLSISRNVLRTQLKRFGLLNDPKADSPGDSDCLNRSSAVELASVEA
jgi:DNA-binding NtrC family response regulator